jgi:hypothetical protein
MAVRQALGASRKHVISEVIVETTLITLTGGLLGLAAGAAGIRFMMALGADRLPLGSQIAFDMRLAAAGILGAVALGIALSLPIAWFILRRQPGNAIQSETRLHRGADRTCFCVVVWGRPAGPQLGKRDGRSTGISPGPRLNRPDLSFRERLSELAGPACI